MIAAVALPLVFALAAHADEAPAKTTKDWHIGLNVRTDLGTHPLRIDGGVRLDTLDLIAVVDPMFWTDGQIDLDLLAAWRFSDAGWAVLGGWRGTAIGLGNGRQWQEKLVVGLTAPLADVGMFRAHWGFEVASVLAKHGADLATEVLSFKNSRYYIDLLNFGMFVRFEYASPFGAE